VKVISDVGNEVMKVFAVCAHLLRKSAVVSGSSAWSLNCTGWAISVPASCPTNIQSRFEFYVGPASKFSVENGAYTALEEHETTYTSASEVNYFGWTDAGQDNARALAEKFVQRFPRVAAECEGRDWTYAGWLLELTGLLERKPSRLPFVLAEYFEPDPLSMHALPLRVYGDLVGDDDGDDLSFPLPPSGYAAR
jgi:hypothetical protein